MDIKTAKICLLDGVAQTGIDVFTEAGFKNVKLFPDSLPAEELKKELSDAVAVGIRSKTKLTKEILAAAPQLVCIGRYGIGVNNVDLKTAGAMGIPVFNGPFSSTRSVAELVIGGIFGLMRQIPQKSMEMHNGGWPKAAKGCFEVRGKTLGLVGYGNIATQISVMAEALGMNVIYSDVRTILPLGNAQQVTFDEVLGQSDVISLHVPGIPSTENMINAQTIGKMKEGSYLINFARGSVVNIEDLKTALQSGHIAGAALDVFPKEPKSKTEPFESEIKGVPNVILTPHVGGATEEAQAALGTEVSQKMKNAILNGDSAMALNFPQINASAPDTLHRLQLIHQNHPGVMAEINEMIAAASINIAAQTLKTQGDIGVAVIDTETELPPELQEKINFLPFTIKCRILS
jgi:D-3-phosphoglycerate dehydrogenase